MQQTGKFWSYYLSAHGEMYGSVIVGCLLQALFLITTQGIPPVKEPERWSRELQDFLSKCLAKETNLRPDANELLQVHQSITFIIIIKYHLKFCTEHMILLCCYSSSSTHLHVEHTAPLHGKSRRTGLLTAWPQEGAAEQGLFVTVIVSSANPRRDGSNHPHT